VGLILKTSEKNYEIKTLQNVRGKKAKANQIENTLYVPSMHPFYLA
jgi:hypothetical protein